MICANASQPNRKACKANQGNHTDKGEIRLLSLFAALAAVAVENARLGEQLRQEREERKRLEEQLRQSQKLEAIGRLACSVAHDFNNILTAIGGYAALLLSDTPPADPKYTDLKQIRKNADRAATLIRQLLAFSRKQVLQPEILDLDAVVGDMEHMLWRLIGEDIELRTRLKLKNGTVRADLGQLEQVIMNLVLNARDAMPQGGQLIIETASVELDEAYSQQHLEVRPGLYAMLAVSDTGIGMDRQTQARVFEPFFTTKEPGKGTGLGLATVYEIIKQSGGHIWVYSEPGQGTTFKIYLPQLKEIAESTNPKQPCDYFSGSETILLVEDEEAVREVARRILSERGYKVLAAAHAAEALHLGETHEGLIQLLVTDVVMPHMSGNMLAERLISLHSEMKVLFISGYTDEAVIHFKGLEPNMPFLQKPFSANDLARKVRQVLDTPRGTDNQLWKIAKSRCE